VARIPQGHGKTPQQGPDRSRIDSFDLRGSESAPTSVDIRFVQELMPGFNVGRTNLPLLHGITMDDLDRLPKSKYWAMEESSPINHVSKDAPPTLLRYNGKLSGRYTIHHAQFGVALKEKMDWLKVRCDLIAGGEPLAGSQRKSIVGFIKEEFAKVESG